MSIYYIGEPQVDGGKAPNGHMVFTRPQAGRQADRQHDRAKETVGNCLSCLMSEVSAGINQN